MFYKRDYKTGEVSEIMDMHIFREASEWGFEPADIMEHLYFKKGFITPNAHYWWVRGR